MFAGMRVGNFCMPRFEVSVADVYAFEFHGWADQPAIIIGMDLLRHTQIKIDSETGAVELEAITRFTCHDRPELFQ
jgi:hypothetical protein